MERLYYTDSYLPTFTANVTDSGDGTKICLDRTAFYPTSGGQPHDLGSLNEVAVIDVVDEGEQIVHVTEQPLAAKTVTGTIDWPRRYDHMQQHTGQHLLSAVFQDLLQIPTVSFHMGADVSIIDLGVKELADEQISRVEEHVNEIARDARAIAITFEEGEAAQGLRKQSERSGILRIITIQGLDRSACGGTHVRQLSEVLPVLIRRTEKMRGNVRLEFACGARAVSVARNDFGTLVQLARLAGTSPDNALAYFSGLKQRLADAEKERQRLANQLAEMEAMRQYAGAEIGVDGVRRVFQRVERINEAQRVKGQVFAKQAAAVLILLSADGVLIACSPDTGLNAGTALKQVIAVCGGSGGGSPSLAQGKLTGPEGEQALLAALGFSSVCPA